MNSNNKTNTPYRELTNEQIDELITELSHRKQKLNENTPTATAVTPPAASTAGKVVTDEYQQRISEIKSVVEVAESAMMVYYRGTIMKIKENYDYLMNTDKKGKPEPPKDGTKPEPPKDGTK